MSSVNDLIIQLQLLREQAPAGTVPVQAAIYLAITFGRPSPDVFTDKELFNCSTFLDHATFIRTVRRLLPLDESGSRSDYTGMAAREDLRGLLKIFGRDPFEVDEYLARCVPEDQVNLNKFLRILAKPIAGQRYPIGVYTVSRPLEGPPTKVYATHTIVRNPRRDRARASMGMPIAKDAVAMALARRVKYQKYRTSILRHRSRRDSDTDSTTSSSIEDAKDDVNLLAYQLCVLEL